MKGFIYAQFKLLVRKPATFLLMTLFMIVFALMLGNTGGAYSSYVPVYSEMNQKDTKRIMESLEGYGSQRYEVVDEEKLMKAVREGDAEAGVLFYEDHFEYVRSAETPGFQLLQQNVEKAYYDFLQEKKIVDSQATNSDDIIADLNTPVFTIDAKSLASEDDWIYDGKLQAIFGFAVFFVIYTIGYNVINLLVAKQNGIWDRFILSPAKKWEMYVGIMVYAFFLGYIQVVLVFSIFKYVLGIDFYGGYWKTLIILIPYVLCIVSLTVLIAGLSKNVQTFNAMIPLISVSFAMIGGAYWPIEIVSNKVMLLLAEVVPIYHVMDAFKQVTLYGQGLTATVFPVSILVLMSIVMMGIGLNLMERRQH
ncbi:ABC transporter permease [Salirhabdus sp. Marseille-P4669]|uniref:ABC transporter permease n=1 Tax=Salirhabdus sp. Marseille-P4669 TaxID=2042310 RepID=UPI000C797C31|nr:ABC transporter permease [Salirhabdus sp. Marseille-P4669]